ncbi:nuclear transport factor 2 family protein [bacterium]|nr:MAG: nuclear transport factor 2 family protein [bacterium]
MKKICLLLLIGISACTKSNQAKLKSEIVEVEAQFNMMAREKGIAEAFRYFAAPDAALNRENKLIIGKDSIFQYTAKRTSSDIELNWKPTHVVMSESGDLASSYGYYSFNKKGSRDTLRGVFHTVWQRQADGSWKYIWD